MSTLNLWHVTSEISTVSIYVIIVLQIKFHTYFVSMYMGFPCQIASV
jgi:hypothetical protein